MVFATASWALGSPPPARRAPPRRDGHGWLPRFTSACAESAGVEQSGSRWSAVHLRLRGERARTCTTADRVGGSPPPARRAPVARIDVKHLVRFTSACAESATPSRSDWSPRSVHLRLRGERRMTARAEQVPGGSPPPARRAPRSLHRGLGLLRFTSACAESAVPAWPRPARAPVHLRLRGERIGHAHASSSVSGSPPPARRAPGRCAHPNRRKRFTSACAESARRRGMSRRRRSGSPPPARRALLLIWGSIQALPIRYPLPRG